MTRSWPLYAGVVAAGVALDQWIKHLVETHLVMHEAAELLPFLALYRTYNTGVAFSMFSWVGDKGLIVLSVAVIAFVLYLAIRSAPRAHPRPHRICPDHQRRDRQSD